MFKHNYFIGSGVLCDGLCKLKLDNLFAETLLTLHHNIGTKRGQVDESSAYLWHKCLGHISKERIQRLVKNEIFPDWILLILILVWIILRENTQNTQSKEGHKKHRTP